MPDMAGLAIVEVLAVPVSSRMKSQQAHREDEQDGQQSRARSFRHGLDLQHVAISGDHFI